MFNYGQNGNTKQSKKPVFLGAYVQLCSGKMVRLSGESSNAFFEVLEDWEAQLKPHEALLPEMEP